MSEEAGFIYIEAKPKFRRFDDVHKTITAMAVLCDELLRKGVGDFNIRTRVISRKKLSLQVIFDDLKDRETLEQNRRYQELLIDLRLTCKRDRLLPFKQLVMTTYKVPQSSS